VVVDAYPQVRIIAHPRILKVVKGIVDSEWEVLLLCVVVSHIYVYLNSD
jgi:hypothetical protein